MAREFRHLLAHRARPTLTRWRLGPGALVAAAFVGPGTIATCSLAGARAGYDLLWALLFSIGATMILQDMAARLGARGGVGLATALIQRRRGALRLSLLVLVLGALGVGNAAYEAGNMAGALVGLDILLGASLPKAPGVLALGVAAAWALERGGTKGLQRGLSVIVGFMSLAFGLAYFGSGPRPGDVAAGLAPSLDVDLALALGLIGTTVVPYNLFLHAAASRDQEEGFAARARWDSVVAIGLGGFVSVCILGAAAELPGTEIRTPTDLAAGLERVLGASGRVATGAGLLAAGVTSALTAPLATGLVVEELLPGRPSAPRWARLAVVLCGVLVGVTGVDALPLIVTAQMANGLLLPVVVAVLLASMNRRDLLGPHVNGALFNAAGGLVLVVGLVLGARLILGAIGG